MSFDVPILFLTYKRYRTTIRVFNTIKKIKPKKLYFASNAPKNNDEIIKVQKIRDITKKINWNCKLIKIFYSKHMLVRDSIPTSINFFFKKEKKGIILEDDVLPSKSFYFFCKKALQTYKNNKSILCITGCRFQKNKNKNIYLSKYPHIWGWATWRSSWKKYDVDMKFWPKFKKTKRFKDFNFNKKECNYWTKIFDKTYLKKINTWDYQWLAASWYYNKFCVIPPINLVQNIGFGLDAENTISREKFIKKKNLKIFFNIPKKLERNHINDYYVFLSHFKALSIFEKIIKYIKLFFLDSIFFFIVIYKKLLLNKR